MKKIVLGSLLLATPFFANASDTSGQWVGGIGYAKMSDDVEAGVNVDVGAIIASLGYKIKTGDNFSLTPEARLGFGVSDDTVSVYSVPLKVELDRFMALSLRGELDLNDSAYLFVVPSYANAKFTVSGSARGYSASASDSSWEFGIGAGAGVNFNETTSAEVSYEEFDGTELLSVGLKFKF